MAAAKNFGDKKDKAIALMAGAKAAGIPLADIQTIRRSNPQAVQRLINEAQRGSKLAGEGTAPVVAKAQGLQGKVEQREGLAESAKAQAQTAGEAARLTPKQKVPAEPDAAAAAQNFNTARDSALKSAANAAQRATGASQRLQPPLRPLRAPTSAEASQRPSTGLILRSSAASRR